MSENKKFSLRGRIAQRNENMNMPNRVVFSIELKAFPADGRMVVLPSDTDDNNSRNGK
jgi:hypothetical protein